MKKRILAIFIAIATIVCTMPTAAFAGSNSTTSNEVAVLGTYVTKDSSADYTTYWKLDTSSPKIVGATSEDYSVKFEFNSSTGERTLTLNNFDMSNNGWKNSGGAYIQLQTAKDVNIVLEGTNVLQANSSYSIYYGIRNVNSSYSGKNGNIAISGTGSLDIHCTQKAIFLCADSTTKSGSLTVNSGTLNIYANEKGTNDTSYGIHVYNYAQNGGTVNIQCGKADSTNSAGATGIYTYNAVGTIAVNAGTLDIKNYADCSSDSNYAGKGMSAQIYTFGQNADVTVAMLSNTTPRTPLKAFYCTNDTSKTTFNLSNKAVYSYSSNGTSQITIEKGGDQTDFKNDIVNLAGKSQSVRYFHTGIETFQVAYKDGADGEVFEDQVHNDVADGSATPKFDNTQFGGDDPYREGYLFKGWSPTLESTVTKTVTYVAQWEKQEYRPYVRVLGVNLELLNKETSKEDYTTYWKVTTNDKGQQILYQVDGANGYNVKYDVDFQGTLDPVRKLYLKGVDAPNGYVLHSGGDSFIMLNLDTPLNVILEGTNTFGGSNEIAVDNVIRNINTGAIIIEEGEDGGSLIGNVETYGIEANNGTGDVTIKSGTIKLNEKCTNQDAAGIRCLNYTQTGGEVDINILIPSTSAVRDASGISGKCINPDDPLGEVSITDGTLNISMDVTGIACGIMGFKKIELGDANIEIILDNDNQRTRLFGINDDDAAAYTELTISNKCKYGTNVDKTTGVSELEKEKTTDQLKTLQLMDSTEGTKLRYYGQGVVRYTVTYNDGVDGEVIFEDEVHSNLHEGSTTPAFNKGTDPTRTGYQFNEWSPTLESTVTKTVTYVAQWTPNAYVIKYAGNGSTSGTMSDQNMTYDTAANLTKNTFERTGYTFNGWKDLEAEKTYTDEQSVTNLTSTNNGTVTMTAQWTPNAYVIHYAKGAEDATGTMSDQNMTYDVAANLTENAFTRIGYVFAGWKDGAGNTYTDKQSVKNLVATSGGEVTLTAQWMPIAYVIKYDGNGNTSGTMSDQNMAYDVETNLTKNAFAKTGYTFNGWKDLETGNTYTDEQSVKNLTTKDKKAITLTAQWIPNAYVIHYAKGAEDASGTMSDQNMTYDVAANLSENAFTRTGYVFAGWKDGAGNTYTDKQSVKNLVATSGGEVTLTAQWTPIAYVIKYDGNGNTSGTMSDQNMNYGATSNLTKNAFVKTGYTFTGWKDLATGTTYTDEQSIKNLTTTDKKVITMTAQWTPNKYVIKYAKGAEDVTGTMSDQNMTYDVAANLTENDFEREDYIFVGWKDLNSGKTYTDKESVKNLIAENNGEVTLTAQWAKGAFIVRFNANDNTKSPAVGVMSNQTFYIGVPQALTKNTYKRDGYVFLGWNTKPNGDGDFYADTVDGSKLSTTIGDVVDLYAQWRAVPNTADSNDVVPYVLLFALAIIGLAGVALKREN